MLSKPSIGGAPITVTATGVAVTRGGEILAFHYLNTTAGAGRVDIYDGVATPGNLRVTLGSDAQNGNDNFGSVQGMRFNNEVRVVFTTGTGVLTIHTA